MSETITTQVIAVQYRQPGWSANAWQLWEEIRVDTEAVEQSIRMLLDDDEGWGPQVEYRLFKVTRVVTTERFELGDTY